MNIALVDDNTGITKLMKKVIASHLTECLIDDYNSSAYFLEKVKTIHYDFVLLDLDFKEDIPGCIVAEKLKNLQPNCKIVILSSLIDRERFNEKDRVGIYRVLEKPLMPNELISMLDEMN